MRYHLRRAEGTVSGLSDTQQTQFGALLERDGPGTAKLARKLDQDEFERVLDLGRRCRSGVSIASSGGCAGGETLDELLTDERIAGDLSSSEVKTVLGRYESLDEFGQGEARELLSTAGADGARLFTDLDRETVETLLSMGRRSDEVVSGGTARVIARDYQARLARLHADGLSTERTNQVVRSVSDLDEGAFATMRAIGQRDVPLGKLSDELDTFDGIAHRDGKVVIEGGRHDVAVEVGYPDSSRAFYDDAAADSEHYDSVDDLRGMSSQEIGRTLAEDDLAPRIIRERENLDLVYGQKKGGTDQGIDLIAYDSDAEEYVVIEVKFTRSDKRIVPSRFSSTRTDEELEQMTHRWIRDSFDVEIDSSDVSGDFAEMEFAIQNQQYRREAIVIQDTPIGETVGDGIKERVDRVRIVRTDEVTK